MPTLLYDLRYALRQLWRSPGFALTAILTLALGIGANVVVFAVLNSLILQPMNFSHPEEVFAVQRRHLSYGVSSYPDYRELRDRNTTFSTLAMYRVEPVGMETSSGAQSVWGYLVSGNYFGMVGIKPYLGRFIQPADDLHPGASAYIVLSYDCWRDRFGGDATIVGRTVRLNRSPYIVLGVAPKGFRGTEKWFSPEFWAPAMNQEQLDGTNWIDARDNENTWIIGRLKPGVTPAAATDNLNAVSHQIAKEFPKTDADLSYKLARPGFIGDVLGGPVKAFVFGIMLLAGLVLLASCTNLGSLFAARISDRSRELAIRLAIGAGRTRILRQMVTESVALSLMGGVVGALAALGLVAAINNWNPTSDFGGQLVIHPDAVVYVFALAISIFAGAFFGMVPARQIWKTDPNQAIKGGPAVLSSRNGWVLRDVLLGCQIAICCLLVTASLVALRGLGRTLHANLGFNPQGVTLATVNLHLEGYSDDAAVHVQQQLRDAAARIPGVTGAAYANTVPLSINQSFTGAYSAETTDFSMRNEKFSADYYRVSPGYFQVAGTRLLAGREFNWHDDAHAPRVAIVNRTFARRMFGTEDAVGRDFRLGSKERIEIVGIAEDGKYTTVSEEPMPAVFLSILHDPQAWSVLLVRSQQSNATTVAEVRDAIRKVDPSLAVSSIGSWRDELSIALLPSYAATAALGVFGILAILLAVTGIFGLASYTVSRRMRELGIRVALGASPAQVLRAALQRPITLLLGGSLVGLALGIAASRLLASIVYQATPNDPLVLFGAVLTMLLIGILATVVPAGRVLRVDPSRVLRDE